MITKKGKKLVVELLADDFFWSSDGFPSCCAADIISDLGYADRLKEEYNHTTGRYEYPSGITEEMYKNRTFEITDFQLSKLKKRVIADSGGGMIFIITASWQKEWESVMEWLGFTHVHTYKRHPTPDGSILTTWMLKPKGYEF